MGALSTINIIFRADLKQFSREMQNSIRETEKLSAGLKTAGRNMSLYVTAPILALGGASLKTYGQLDALKRGLTSVTGSGAAAAAEFKDLEEVAKLPGLGIEEAVRGAINLQAAGDSAEMAKRELLAFGNALATVGKGKRELDLVILALTQLQNKETGFGQDLRQLTEQLPQLRGALKAAFGTADSEKISKLGVTGKQVVFALTKEFEKLPKVTGGINNAFENTSDSVTISLAAIGESINKAFNVEGLLTDFSESLTGVTKGFSQLSPEAQKVILVTAGIAAAIGPVLLGLGGIISLYPTVVVGFTAIKTAFTSLSASMAANPITAVLGVMAAVVAVTIVATSRFTALTNAADEFSDTMSRAAGSIAKEKAALEQNLSIARDKNESDDRRKKAIEAINALSPKLLGNLTLETINTDAATKAIDKYNIALIKRAQVTAAQEKLVDVEKRLLDLQLANLDAVRPSVWQALGNAISSTGDASQFAASQGNTLIKNFGEENKSLAELREKLVGFIGENEKYADVVGTVTAATETQNALQSGTIAYYEAQIAKLQELQKTVATTSGAFAAYGARIDVIQKKIDAIEGKRVEVKAIEVDTKVGTGEPENVKQLRLFREALVKTQSAAAEGSARFTEIQKQIDALDYQIKIELVGLDGVKQELVMLPPLVGDATEAAAEKLKNLQDTSEAVSSGFASAFESMGSRFLDSLDLADDGIQGFFKALSSTIIKIISAMLAQSMAQSIAGATAAGAATGPASPFTTPAFIAEAIGGVLAAFAAIPKFESGGVVGGSSYFGDKLMARVNSGEAFLNRKQQKAALALMDNGGGMAWDGRVSGEIRLSGRDMLIALGRADAVNKRNG
jgi:tape measure domain-containing protein